MTFSWQDLDALAHVENVSLRVDKGSKPKGLIRGNTKYGPVLEVNATNHLQRYGIEIKMDSVQKDGTQSWIVISRSINKYVTELPEEIKKPIHCEDVALSTVRFVPMKQKQQFIPSSSSSSPAIVPIFQRTWNDISAVVDLMTKPTKSRS